MDLTALLSSWEQLITDVEPFLTALEGGEPGVIHALGNYADDAIQSLVPAYASAVAICKQIDVPQLGVSCEAERVKLRDGALSEILHATGMIRMIDEAISLYHKVPAPIRSVVKNGAAALHSAGELLSHPSIQNLSNTAKNTVKYAGSLISVVPKLYALAPEYAKKLGSWIGKYGSKTAAAIGALLAGLGGLLGSAGGELLALGDKALDTAEDAVKAVSHVISGGASLLEDAATSTVKAGEDVVSTGLNLANDGISAIVSLF